MNIAYVKIKGGFFEEEEKLDFFIKKESSSKVNCSNFSNCANPPIPSQKISLFRHAIIYGENGSGKSTISNAFEKYKSHDNTDFSISLFDKNDAGL